MAVQYNKLFKRLIDLKMTNAQLIENAGISANIIGRLKRDEYISLESIEKICSALRCTPNDIIDFIPTKGDQIDETNS